MSPTTSTTITATTLHLSNLTTTLTLPHDAFSRPKKPQPALLSVCLTLPTVPSACSTDDLDAPTSTSLSYSKIQAALSSLSHDSFPSFSSLAEQILTTATSERWPYTNLELRVRLPKAVLRAEGLEYVATFTKENKEGKGVRKSEEYTIHALRIACVIGVNPHERTVKQDVLLTFSIPFPPSSTNASSNDSTDTLFLDTEIEGGTPALIKQIVPLVEASSYKTVEKLGARVGEEVLALLEGLGGVGEVRVKVMKPTAYALVESVGCEVTVRSEQG